MLRCLYYNHSHVDYTDNSDNCGSLQAEITRYKSVPDIKYSSRR